MLILTRRSNESVVIGNNVEVKILAIHGDQVSLGFSAPREVAIHRKEVYESVQKENIQAAERSSEDMQKLRESFSDGHLSLHN